MIPRTHTQEIQRKLDMYPAVALLGPRQCGKTTLARMLGGKYFDLEIEGDATRLDAEWERLAAGDDLVVLDEAQTRPEVFGRLRGTIDADRRRNGRFLLLGSVSPSLMQEVSESLAGRLGLVRLGPFLLPELEGFSQDDLWLYGGFPEGGILDPPRFPDWQNDYLELLAARDLPNWGLSAKPRTTARLMRMLAAIHGQTLNASQIGANLSLDYKTVQTYCDYLEGAYLIRRLPPYQSNIGKRLVKRPKVFWRDSGLFHALSGVTSREAQFHSPLLGADWEGFVIEQTLGLLQARGRSFEPFFFRTSDGYELDLVLDMGAERWAMEIKLTSNPTRESVQRLNKTADMIDAAKRILVCNVQQRIDGEGWSAVNLEDWTRDLRGDVEN